jgi:hypothetical protein
MVTQVGNWICRISGFKFDADQVGFLQRKNNSNRKKNREKLNGEDTLRSRCLEEEWKWQIKRAKKKYIIKSMVEV